jgi:methyl-accepting chemotaxis protein
MAILLRLLRELVLAFVGVGALGLFVARSFGAPGEAGPTDVRTLFTWPLAVELAACALLAWIFTRTFRAAAARARELSRDDVARATISVHRLPIRMGLGTMGIVAAGAAAVMAPAFSRGDAPDLAAAGIALGLAAAILLGMLSYSSASARVGAALEALGPAAEAGLRGSVRGKILTTSFGLFFVAVLLVGASSYARFRHDADQAALDAAAAAQQGAAVAADLDSHGASASPAWMVFHVTHLPSAVLGVRGEVLSRAGTERGTDRAVPFAKAFGAGPLVRLEDGWLVATRTPRGSTIVTRVEEGPLWRRRQDYLVSMGGVAFAVFLGAAVLAWYAAASITKPFRTLGRAADRIASGDLTASPTTLTRDEMGQLATDFRRMAVGLRALLLDVRSANREVAEGARETAAIAERVREGALVQHTTVVAVDGSVEAMESSMTQVTRGIDSLQAFVESTTTLVGETASAFEEVRRKGADLEKAVETTLADVARLSEAGHEAEQQLHMLETMASDAGASLASVRNSAGAMERTAGEGEGNAETVARMSERASGIVLETVHGIETLRAAVGDAHRRIGSLGRRSDDIDQVVIFIAEVAGRTNLLSLNASIIASQAGEHGKAFSVVADQIRELAAQISRSTKSIGDIIHAVREDVEATAALIDRGDALAGEGVQLARNSYEALAQIQRQTVQGREAAAGMRRAAESHGNSTREVSRLVQTIADGTRAVTNAVQLVGRSVSGVDAVSKNVGAMADQLTKALDGQVGGAGRQLENVGRLEGLIGDTTRAARDHATANKRVRESLHALTERAAAHEAAVAGLFAVAEQLGKEASELGEQMARFRLD